MRRSWARWTLVSLLPTTICATPAWSSSALLWSLPVATRSFFNLSSIQKNNPCIYQFALQALLEILSNASEVQITCVIFKHRSDCSFLCLVASLIVWRCDIEKTTRCAPSRITCPSRCVYCSAGWRPQAFYLFGVFVVKIAGLLRFSRKNFSKCLFLLGAGRWASGLQRFSHQGEHLTAGHPLPARSVFQIFLTLGYACNTGLLFARGFIPLGAAQVRFGGNPSQGEVKSQYINKTPCV